MKLDKKEVESLYLNKTIVIINMEGEPHYTGRTGVVTSVDDAGQLHGTWGGLAILPNYDSFSIVKGGEQ